ncbi:ABC transporter ATP-binding protein [Dactylosporangium vinaceum]|uniref:ABC transporter ATP-binding protein n=1 Tax=Dactylosporangium vinaceum TaxID=53362 RepID=A0ABV5MU02_9ACTN
MGPVRVNMADESITRQKVRPGTLRRIVPFLTRYRWSLALLLLTTIVDAAITAANPLMLKEIIDSGIMHRRAGLVAGLAAGLAGLAALDAVVVYIQSWCSGRIGQGTIYDLRRSVFDHIQRQPLSFFMRAQTGALVSRLNGDVIGAQMAVTTLLTQALSAMLTLLFILAEMLYLSWQIAIASLVVIPLFLVPARLIGRRNQRLTREGMQQNAQLGSMMTERFNISGALLAKLYGRPEEESAAIAERAGRIRDIATAAQVYGRMFFIIATLLASLTTALVYGFGGSLVIDGSLQIGTLVAMIALLMRIYSPVNQLTGLQVNVMTALVSFDRLFEVLDLEPLIRERPGAVALAGDGRTAPDIQFDAVSFRYPDPAAVSLESLESPGKRAKLPVPRQAPAEAPWVLRDVTFRAPGGKLTALVGASGAGKTTITHLVPRLYDVGHGAVRIGGQDVRDVTTRSLHDTIGVVTQDAHLFHDTIRANLTYARPDAGEGDLVAACEAAQIWDTIRDLPDGLDTVVGDRGYRLSGGEKQRIALARLLLKAPQIVVLDEATAHLDSESEAAVQRALETALAGRTALIIAHRLSTIRHADQILVVDDGRIRESGTHEELLALGGLYAELHRTQFAWQAEPGTAVESTPA